MIDAAIATMTWARDADEEQLLMQTLSRLAELGLPMAIADTGTSVSFTRFLERLPAPSLKLSVARGLVAQVQSAVADAASFGRRFIFYTEPDKLFFFEQRLRAFLDAAPGEADVGVVIASRSPESHATYPPMQQYTEGVASRLCEERIHLQGDFFYGPFLMNAALASEVAKMPPVLGWGWRPAAFAAAHERGLRVVIAPGDYPCPEDQREESAADRLYRIRQLSQNLLGVTGV